MGYFERKFDLPARYVLAIWCFLGYMVVMAMRVNLSVAIVAMVNNSPTNDPESNVSTPLVCQDLFLESQKNSSASRLEPQGEFNWDRNTQSNVLGAINYGVIASRLPGGLLSDKWSAKWTIGLSTLFGSLLTMLSPVAARWNVNAFIALRVIIGLTQGVMISSCSSVVGRWAPKMERSGMLAIIISGASLGTIVGFTLSGFLIKSNPWGGWPSVFYVSGILGCVWCAFWFFLIYDKPEEHPRISPSELLYITENGIAPNATPKVPWLTLLSSVHVWALILAHFGHTWYCYTLFYLMPTYLANILHISIENNDALSSLPYLLLALTNYLAGYAGDKLRQSEKFSVTTIRKTFNSVAFFGAGLLTLLVVYVECRPAVSISLLCLSLGCTGANSSGYLVTHVDMSPQFSGILSGIIATIGSSAGFMAPYVAGIIRANGETLDNWGMVFGITAGVGFVSGVIYDLFASSELQSWNSPLEDRTPEETVVLQNHSESKTPTTSDKTNFS